MLCWIIEDEPPAMRRIQKLLGEVAPEIRIGFTSDSVSATRKALATLPHPDFVLSDIHLADGNSFDIWEAEDPNFPIVFTTAYDQYSLRAFRVNSVDYLLKPVERDDLSRTLDKLRRLHASTGPATDWKQLVNLLQHPPTYRQRFLAQHRNEWLPLAINDILHFYSQDGLSFALTTNGQRYLLDETLDRIEAELDPQRWFRINRAQIVCIEAVRKVKPYFNSRLHLELRPDPGLDNIVSRPRVKACRDWMNG